MKRNLLYALTAVAMLTGCAKNDVVDSEINKEGNLIGFSTYKNISRGNPVDDNKEFLTKNNNFGVTAFIDDKESPYMGTVNKGIEIVSDGSKWTYANAADQAYWPTNNEVLDFYAYAPYNNTAIETNFSNADGLEITYTVPATEAEQVDLMYASALDQLRPAKNNSVTLPFKHALTQVHFKIGTKTTNLKVDVKANGIQIHNLKNSGTFSTKNETWTLTDDDATAGYTVTSEEVLEAGYYGDDQSQYTTIGNADNALMLLPQTFEAKSETQTNGAYLTISCKIYQVLADKEGKTYLHGSESEYKDIIVGISSQKEETEIWERNKKVTYNLLIGAAGSILKPIEFETTVEDWKSADGGVIEPTEVAAPVQE